MELYWSGYIYISDKIFIITTLKTSNPALLLMFEKNMFLWSFINILFCRHTSGRIFSCRGLQICIDYFLKRNHRVVAFVPQFRRSSRHSLDSEILDRLEKEGLVSFTPSRKVGDRLVVPYDDRWVVRLELFTLYTNIFRIQMCAKFATTLWWGEGMHSLT
jgi:hypothetical protein